MPIVLSLAVFHGWTRTLLIVGLYLMTEIVVANFVEPMLYGANTGISSLAILVAAVFWTLLWGPVGLVLSTPLTVCLVVLGRYVPQMKFLHVLLGDEPVLSPDMHFYQRMLAADLSEARQVLVMKSVTRLALCGRAWNTCVLAVIAGVNFPRAVAHGHQN